MSAQCRPPVTTSKVSMSLERVAPGLSLFLPLGGSSRSGLNQPREGTGKLALPTHQ